MKRIMLAAGPWMMCAKNQARRIVLSKSRSGGRVVVHTETYEPTGNVGREVTFTSGQHFDKTEIDKAVCWWKQRNQEIGVTLTPADIAPVEEDGMTFTAVGGLWTPAPADFAAAADAAHAAELAQQGCRNPMSLDLTLDAEQLAHVLALLAERACEHCGANESQRHEIGCPKHHPE